MVATLTSTDPMEDRCPICGLRLRDGKTEIALLTAENERLRANLIEINEALDRFWEKIARQPPSMDTRVRRICDAQQEGGRLLGLLDEQSTTEVKP
jgi:hypothetical protein